MQEANFSSLAKTLFWIITIYYVVKFLARLFLPVIAKKVVEKATEQFQQNYQNQQQQKTSNGTTNPDKPKETKKVGEYIDYEEI